MWTSSAFSPTADSKASVLRIRIISHILPDFSVFTGLHIHCRLKFNTIKATTLFLLYLPKYQYWRWQIFFFFFAVACLLVYLGKYCLSVSSYFPASREAPYPGKERGHKTRLPNNVKKLCMSYTRALSHGSKGLWSPSCRASGLDVCSNLRLLPFAERKRGFPHFKQQ